VAQPHRVAGADYGGWDFIVYVTISNGEQARVR